MDYRRIPKRLNWFLIGAVTCTLFYEFGWPKIASWIESNVSSILGVGVLGVFALGLFMPVILAIALIVWIIFMIVEMVRR